MDAVTTMLECVCVENRMTQTTVHTVYMCVRANTESADMCQHRDDSTSASHSLSLSLSLSVHRSGDSLCHPVSVHPVQVTTLLDHDQSHEWISKIDPRAQMGTVMT